jgi:hypothetical protein
MGNEIADYLAKKGTKISQTSACKHFTLPNQKVKEAFKLTSQNTTPFKASINPGAK